MTTFRILLTLLILITLSLTEPRKDRGGNRRRENNLANSGSTEEFKNGTKEDERRRKGRLFSLFNVVTFKNDPCITTATTTSGTARNGTCLTLAQCSERTGAAMGNCAAGFGVCCLFVVQAGSSQVRENCSYVQNEAFPQPLPDDAASVMVTVQKCSSDVCFLRLDFESFTLLGTGDFADAVEEGTCLDTFTVTTPAAVATPVICGTNTGQHIYVDVGANDGDTAVLAFDFDAADAIRMWDIKVTQIECTNPNAPPEVCLQYLVGLTGRIETFNFNAMNENHLNNQMYSVCLRQEAGFCCVRYRVCQDQMDLLGVDAQDATSGFSFDTTNVAMSAKNDDDCVSATNTVDYIAIPESSGQCNVNAAQTRAINSRYCGQFLNFVEGLQTNADICDCTAPFSVDIFFNANADAGTMNTVQSKGLCLEYSQVPC